MYDTKKGVLLPRLGLFVVRSGSSSPVEFPGELFLSQELDAVERFIFHAVDNSVSRSSRHIVDCGPRAEWTRKIVHLHFHSSK